MRSKSEAYDSNMLSRLGLVSEGVVSIDDACKFLSCARRTVYDLMSKGELAWTQVGGRRKIPRIALQMLLEKNLVDARRS